MTNQIISYFANKKKYPCPSWQGGFFMFAIVNILKLEILI
jgi:hypothetical protein